jgi:2-polyprenyl-3-methyl-5-hydroxy-6-metoxy-1,4-benzoquinol methylase
MRVKNAHDGQGANNVLLERCASVLEQSESMDSNKMDVSVVVEVLSHLAEKADFRTATAELLQSPYG